MEWNGKTLYRCYAFIEYAEDLVQRLHLEQRQQKNLISRFIKAYPDMLIAAGTVLTTEQD